MQLLGPDVNVAGKDIIHDNILHKGAPVVLFLVEDLGIVQRDVGHGAVASGRLIIAGAENGVLKIVGGAHNGLKGLLGKGDHTVGRVAHLQGRLCPALTKHGHIRTGYHTALRIDHAKGTVGDIS